MCVDLLAAYLNRTDLSHDLRETVRQLREADACDTPVRSVKTISHDDSGRRKLANRLTAEQVRELVATFETGSATRLQLAKRYGIGLTSVAKLLREWRKKLSQDGAA
jgi:hypothetical protein